MKSAEVNGVTLEYEVVGAGESLLLISPVLADGFLPLLSERPLADRHRLIRYHKRGWVGSTHTSAPVTIADHVADAHALLQHLGIRRAHIAGHSTGGAVALQLALDHPEVVHTLCLLEPMLCSVPSADALFKKAQPAFDAYAAGRHQAAFAMFMSVASGLDWEACRAVLDEHIPGAEVQAMPVRDDDDARRGGHEHRMDPHHVGGHDGGDDGANGSTDDPPLCRLPPRSQPRRADRAAGERFSSWLRGRLVGVQRRRRCVAGNAGAHRRDVTDGDEARQPSLGRRHVDRRGRVPVDAVEERVP